MKRIITTLQIGKEYAHKTSQPRTVQVNYSNRGIREQSPTFSEFEGNKKLLTPGLSHNRQIFAIITFEVHPNLSISAGAPPKETYSCDEGKGEGRKD